MNDLVRPAAVIASHPNEGVTAGGKLKPQTRTAVFTGLVKGRPVYLALSGKTMEFDGSGAWRVARRARVDAIKRGNRRVVSHASLVT